MIVKLEMCFVVLVLTNNLSFLYLSSDLECIFTVICNLVSKLDNPDEEFEVAKLISTKITQQPNDKPVMRLKM